jgi:hypothetical protein
MKIYFFIFLKDITVATHGQDTSLLIVKVQLLLYVTLNTITNQDFINTDLIMIYNENR